jgi:hypothetical protein
MIAISSSSESISEYQRLLVSEWRKSFPEEVLALLWSVISIKSTTSFDDRHKGLEQLLNPDNTSEFPEQLFQTAIDRIKEVKKFIRIPSLPELPEAYEAPKRMAKSVWLANRLASYLALPAHAPIEGDMDFFVDIQALAFQAAIHYALPAVNETHPAEFSILVHSATIYAFSYMSHDPSHYAYMISMLYDYLGDEDLRLRLLYTSFRFTSPGDHSFLTKAQEYWSELLDRRRYEEAENFLFSLQWWSLPGQKEEVREMFIDAMTHILRQKKLKTTA